MDGTAMARRLTGLKIPGVLFSAVRFTPAASNFSGKTITGVRFTVTDRQVFSSSQLGLAVAASLTSLYPKKLILETNRNLVGNNGVMRALASGIDPSLAADAGIKDFLWLRQRFLIYP